MKDKLRIAVITSDQSLAANLEIRLQSKGYRVVPLTRLSCVLGFVYSDPPDLMIVDLSRGVEITGTIIRDLKGDCYFSTIPLIGLIDAAEAESFPWDECPLDDFVFTPIKYGELFPRLILSIQRIQRVLDNNPLTRLPGNTSIQHAVEQALGKPMAVCYMDINHFKPYNDVYGFSHGDEVLRMLARVMFNAVKESGGGFSGHIGGDDYVFIVPIDRADVVCRTIIDNFSAIAADLFEEQEKNDGYYIATNRKGQEEKFPLLSIAIAVVPTVFPVFNHYGKVAETAAELKKLAKKSPESCYLIDQRNPEPAS
ncbi:MAG TPA: diguanylate cyclase [Geobacteraceae bacterium]|nr:diguanylate cyclase [Geobacteraceae bacterium]